MGIVKQIQGGVIIRPQQKRRGKTTRTDAIPHEPAIFIADELVEINPGFNPVSVSVTDVGEENVTILQKDIS